MNKIYEDLTIVTVLYDSSELINDLLKNLINFKVIVVDNGNNEQILKKLSDLKNVKVITQKKNLGYGRAINFAFEKIKSKYFFVLNPDLVISEKSIYDLYTLITKNPDAGIVAPITRPDEDFYGLFPEKSTKKKLGPNEIRCRNLLQNSNIDGEICVDVAKGCALLLNSEYFEKIGKFDERYFLFWEEIDLCRRLKNSFKNSAVVHFFYGWVRIFKCVLCSSSSFTFCSHHRGVRIFKWVLRQNFLFSFWHSRLYRLFSN